MNEDVKKLVRYCPETGHITRLSDGKVLGWPDKNGYIELRVKGKTYKAHRLAFYLMGVEVPPVVDHPNGVPWDNRWSNLKASTHADNMKNCKRNSLNTSGVTGVSWCKTFNKWFAKLGGKTLGAFKTKEEAIAVRMEAQRQAGYSERHGK